MINRVSRRTFLQVVGAGCAGTIPSPTGTVAAQNDTDNREPTIQPIFTSASELSGNWHEDAFANLLEEAVPGTTAHASIFQITREEMVEPFLEAAERGVDVHVLIDQNAEHNSPTNILRERLPDRTHIVREGGIGDRHNHNKFLIVEEAENGDRGVIWQSSHNFTRSQIRRHNTSLVIRNDAPLYEAYRTYWDDLAAGSDHNLSYNRTEEGHAATVYFSPRDDIDTHVHALEDIVPSWRTKIHFTQSIWTTSRENESGLIRNVLTSLINEGARVKVIMAERDDTPSMLEEAGAEVVQSRGIFRVHSKTMLIDSEFDTGDGGTERRREVWTGTQNLSRPGIRRNDEVLLRIVDEDIYNSFMLDWERVYLEAKSREPVEYRSEEPGGDSHSDAGAEPPTDADSGHQGDRDEFGTLPGQNADEDGEAGPSPGFGLTLAAGAIAGAAAWEAHRSRSLERSN